MIYLFEQLAKPPEELNAAFDLPQAVANQIQRLVITRVVESGRDLNLLECGIANVVELGQGNKTALTQYAARLTKLILRYEPRLLQPQVKVESNGKSAVPYRLAISGKLAKTDEPSTFYFELPTHS